MTVGTFEIPLPPGNLHGCQMPRQASTGRRKAIHRVTEITSGILRGSRRKQGLTMTYQKEMPLFVVPTSKARTSLQMDPWYGLRVVIDSSFAFADSG